MKGSPTSKIPITFLAVLCSRLRNASPKVRLPPPGIAIEKVPMFAIECNPLDSGPPAGIMLVIAVYFLTSALGLQPSLRLTVHNSE